MPFVGEAEAANTAATMEDPWHGWDAGAHCLLENTGENWSNATAAGSFSERKTGGFGSFRCLCMGTATPMHLPNTSPAREQQGVTTLCSVSPPWSQRALFP